MKIHNALIIDDDQSTHIILKKLCSKHSFMKIDKSFTNPIEAFKYVEKNEIDLIFLDIEMPDLNGIDFIKNMNKKVDYIIISSKRDHAFHLVGNQNIVGYIHKPINEESFNKKVDIYISRNNKLLEKPNENSENEDYIFVNYERKIIKIETQNILLLESRGDYVYVKTDAYKNYLIKSTLKKFTEKLPNSFIRVHKSYIINLKKVNEIQNNIIIIDKEHVPLSKTYSKLFKQNIITI